MTTPTKTCKRCRTKKPKTEFHKAKQNKDGLQRNCKTCNIEINKKRYHALDENGKKIVAKSARELRKKLRKEVELYKAKVGCKYCPENEGCCLDLHHANNDKAHTVSEMINGKNREKIWAEIDKCIVVCANCHRKIHAGIIQD